MIPDWVDPMGFEALRAFAHGCGGLIAEVGSARRYVGQRPMVFWGVHKWSLPQRRAVAELQDAQRATGAGLVILERGYVRRDEYYAVCLDDLNGRGRFPHGRNVPPDRWEALGVELEPYGPRGPDVVIVGQIPWDTACQHVDHQGWVREQAERFPGAVFRPHPLQPGMVDPCGLRVDRGPLRATLERARLVVTFSSTTGVEAVIAGLPTEAHDRTSMAYDVGNRETWAHWLAYCQWTLEELRSGEAGRHVGL